MKPFKPKRRYDNRIITYKRLFLITLTILFCYAWYNNCDEISSDNVNSNANKTSEVQ